MNKGFIYVIDCGQLPSFVSSAIKTKSEHLVSNLSYIKSKLHNNNHIEWGKNIFVYSSSQRSGSAWQSPILLSSHVIVYDTVTDKVEIKKDMLQSGAHGLVTNISGGYFDFLSSPSKALRAMAEYNFQPEEPLSFEAEMAIVKQGGRFSVRSVVYKL